MNRKVISLCLSLGIMFLVAGCAGKNVSSSSGDQSGKAKTETIQPDAIKTVPMERSFDRPSGSASTLATEPGVPPDTNALADIFFDYDRFQIRKDAMPLLDGNARWLRGSGSKSVLIEGHCDERGTVAYNLVLGEKRARATKQFLQDLGIPASQLQITSYGEARPFCKQQNEDCYQQNRRAHFAVK